MYLNYITIDGSSSDTNGQTYRSLIAKFMRPTWGPPGSYRHQMGPMLAPWTLLSRNEPTIAPWCSPPIPPLGEPTTPALLTHPASRPAKPSHPAKCLEYPHYLPVHCPRLPWSQAALTALRRPRTDTMSPWSWALLSSAGADIAPLCCAHSSIPASDLWETSSGMPRYRKGYHPSPYGYDHSPYTISPKKRPLYGSDYVPDHDFLVSGIFFAFSCTH